MKFPVLVTALAIGIILLPPCVKADYREYDYHWTKLALISTSALTVLPGTL